MRQGLFTAFCRNAPMQMEECTSPSPMMAEAYRKEELKKQEDRRLEEERASHHSKVADAIGANKDGSYGEQADPSVKAATYTYNEAEKERLREGHLIRQTAPLRSVSAT